MGIKAVGRETGMLTILIKETVNGAGTFTIRSTDNLV